MDVCHNTISSCGNGITHEDFGDGDGGNPEEINIIGNTMVDIGYPYNTSSPVPAELGLAFNKPTNCTISNNTILNCSGTCIRLSGADDVSVMGNTLTGYPADPKSTANTANGIQLNARVDPVTSAIKYCTGVQVIGGSVKSVRDRGVWIETLSTKIKVIGVNVQTDTKSGIRVDTATDNVTIRDNDIDAGNGVDLELFSGSTNLRVKDNNPVNQVVDYRTFAGNPTGTITPRIRGEDLLDSTNNAWYKAYGLTSSDWA